MPLPYYKRFPRDFLEGTISLTFEEKGAYALLLDLIYMRDGRLEDDPRWIAGQMNCSVRLWNKIRTRLIAIGKISVQNGIISNFRANLETESSRSFQDKQRENRTNLNKNKDLQTPKNNQTATNQNQNQNQKKEDDDVSAGASVVIADDWPEPKTTVGELVRLAGMPSNDWQLHTVGELVRWRTNGFSFKLDVVPAVSAVWLKVRHKPPRSWAYFTDAIAQHHANRLTPIAIPEAQNERRSQYHQAEQSLGRSTDYMRAAIEAVTEQKRAGTG